MRVTLVLAVVVALVACKGKAEEKRAEEERPAGPVTIEGTWRMERSIPISQFIEGQAAPPAAPGTWTFTPEGRFEKRGGSELDGTYVLRDTRLVIRARGVTLNYTIDSLTSDQLVVSQMIMEGTGTRTVLRREPAPAP